MDKNYERFLTTFDSPNTAKVARSMSAIGEFDYANATPVDIENIILDMKPNSPKSITTIVYVLSLYAKFIGNDDAYYMTQDMDRNALWALAKKNASKKFISSSQFKETVKDIELYEEYNSLYISALFRSLYDGIYNDDMSVVKNLKSSDISGNSITLYDDDGNSHTLEVSPSLISDLHDLGKNDVWQRNNRFGVCNIKITGLHKDTCFKVENRKGSSEYSYRYTYYRILRKIAKDYVGYGLLPLQVYVSGIMYRIGSELKAAGITIEEAFSDNNKNRMINGIISDELERSHCDTEVRNFREMVKGHLDVFQI